MWKFPHNRVQGFYQHNRVRVGCYTFDKLYNTNLIANYYYASVCFFVFVYGAAIYLHIYHTKLYIRKNKHYCFNWGKKTYLKEQIMYNLNLVDLFFCYVLFLGRKIYVCGKIGLLNEG